MIRLLGTSHISPDSIRAIREEIGKDPECVAVELDPARYRSLRRGGDGEYPSLLFRFLAWVQRRLGKETGVIPGEEMLEAVDCAASSSVPVYLIDQPIYETLQDFESVGLWEKLKLVLSSLTLSPSGDFSLDEVPPIDLVRESLEHIERHAPGVYSTLVEKRDGKMAEAIRGLSERHDDILAVVGAGHLPGIKRRLRRNNLSVEDKTF